jgi:hypothetical protein
VNEALLNNLDTLTDLRFLYNKCNTLQKQQLVNAVFDQNLFYYECIYRTPTLLPVFQHNLLILKEKRLLEMDEIKKNGTRVPSGGGGGNRTRVQTYSSKAFYMLISLLFVGDEQEMN